MSIMPAPYSPAFHRQDPNSSSNSIVHKILQPKQPFVDEPIHQSTCLYSKKLLAIKIVQNIYFQLFITVFTIFSLFLQDLRVIFVDISADPIVDGMHIMFICIFTFQIMLSLSVPGYLCSFFFYLDILSTISIIMDISMLTNVMYSTNSTNSGLQFSVIIKSSKASRAAARAVRVMKIFRLARIVKLYKSATKANELKSKKIKAEINQRLLSMKLKKLKQAQNDLQNIVSLSNIKSRSGSKGQILNNQNSFFNQNLIKNFEDLENSKSKKARGKVKKENTLSKLDNLKQDDANNGQDEEVIDQQPAKLSKTQSKISKLLSQNSMKKIIIIILLLMFSAPILDVSNFYQQTSQWDFLTDFIVVALQKPQIPIQKINLLIQKQIEDSINSALQTQKLILFKTPFKQLYYYDSGELSTQRINDLTISQSQMDVSYIMQVRNNTLTLMNDQYLNTVTMVFSCKIFNQYDSWFSISKITLICIGIIYLLNAFNQNITQLITEPIQKMLQDVKNNGQSNSLYVASQQSKTNDSKKIINNYETTNVHLALTKISKMIEKIFGVKGKQNIYKKIFQEKSVVENYLSKNKRVFRIFGLCTIDNYYAISQILQQETLLLNKEVSEYLHSAVYRYGGNGVINNQGSFTVVFEVPANLQYLVLEHESQTNLKDFDFVDKNQKKKYKNLKRMIKPRIRQFQKQNISQERQKQNSYLNVLSDFAVFSMVKTIVKISKQAKFYKYRKDTRLIKVLGDNFQIKLNCTLHAGWVEEGFLGSSLKMDFFYFGQTIQTLKKISYYCHKLSNSIILSNSFYKMLSEGIRRYTRIMDKYISKQHQIQQQLYLVDLNLQNISPPKSIAQKKISEQISSVSLKRILNMQVLQDENQMKKYHATSFINSKKQLREALKNVVSQQFRRKYTLAFQLYAAGQPIQSKQILDQICPFNKDDHLVTRLNNLIEKSQKQRFKEPKYQLDQEEHFIQF